MKWRLSSYASVASTVILILGTGVAVLTGRLVLEAREDYLSGREFERDGDRSRAVRNFENSVRAYVPGNDWSRMALSRLSVMARSAVMRGDLERARYLFEVIRRSILSVRHFRIPYASSLRDAEKQISELEKRQSGQALETGSTARPDDPSPLASLFLFFGMLIWIAGSATGTMASSGRVMFISLSVGTGGLLLWLTMACFA